MIRLALAAALLTALALPAQAQRLDTRVREIRTGPAGTSYLLNANTNVRLDESKAEAWLSQSPVEERPGYAVSLTMSFSPRSGYNVIGLQILPTRSTYRPPMEGARLLLDGEDSGVTLSLEGDYDHTERGYVTIPEADRQVTARRMLDAHWFEFVIDEGQGKLQRYRFDALRIRDVTDILAIIHYSCTGARAD